MSAVIRFTGVDPAGNNHVCEIDVRLIAVALSPESKIDVKKFLQAERSLHGDDIVWNGIGTFHFLES